MVENLADELFSFDELVELGNSLEKAKDDGRSALSILKVLEKKSPTSEQLVDTKIGKKLTAVKEDFPEDIELQADIKQLKELLKKKWLHIHKSSK